MYQNSVNPSLHHQGSSEPLYAKEGAMLDHADLILFTSDDIPAATEMANPPHPGDAMRELIEMTGLTITQAAKAAGFQRTFLSAMLNGEKPVTIESAMKFEAAFGGPAPTVIATMSARREQAKALQHKSEITAGITRVPISQDA